MFGRQIVWSPIPHGSAWGVALCLLVLLLSGASWAQEDGYPVPAQATVLAEADRALYTKAFEAADKGQWNDALGLAARASDPLLAEVLIWRHMQDSSAPYTFAEMTSFLAARVDWPGMAGLRRRVDEAISGTDDPEALIAWYEANPPFTGRGRMLFAEALMGTGERDRAIAVVRSAWVNNTFNRADERRFLARFDKFLDAEQHRRRLDRLLWEGHPEAARRMFLRVDADARALAQARLALIMRTGGVDSLVAKVPNRLQDDPGLIYDRLRWRRQAGMEDRAAELFDHPAANQVRPARWWRERALLVRHFLDSGHVSRAYTIAAHHGMESGAGFADGEWLAGWISLRFLNDPQTALAHFTRLHDGVSYPISVSRGAYWSGRASEALGQTQQAADWYARAAEHGTTYYGQLAAGRLGRADRLSLPPPPDVMAEDQEAFDRDVRVRVARLLHAIDRAEDARPFLYRVNEDTESAGVRRLAAELAASINRPDIAVALARRAALRGTLLLDTGYPVLDVDTANTPEAALVHALIRQESNFNTLAVSRAGARGLMQLMPATAKLAAGQQGVPHSIERLYDPAHNVRLGTAYLQQLLDRFDGSYALSLAGYNAGPSRPARWVREYGDPRIGDLDIIDWIEMIPFAETRNYVQRVMEAVQVYRVRLGIGDVALSLDEDLSR